MTKEQIKELVAAKFSETDKLNLGVISHQETLKFVTEVLVALGYSAASINVNKSHFTIKNEGKIGFD